MGLRRVLFGLLVAGLLLPAVALSVARVSEPTSGTGIRLVAFTEYAAPLYAAALILLLLRMLARRGERTVVLRTLAVVAALGVAVHLLWASGPYFGGARAAAGQGEPFTLVTANLRLGHADPVDVTALAGHWHADVLVLQEVTAHELAGLKAAGLSRSYAFSAGRPDSGAAGTMVFADTRITGVKRLDTSFGGYAMTLHRPRGPVRLVAVHATPPTGSGAGWSSDQHAILRGVGDLRPGPTVLAGDFNATLDHEPLRELGGRGYTDAVVEAKSGWQPTWPSDRQVSLAGVPLPPLLQIDHVLVGDGLRALKTTTVAVPGTDHRAVVARLELS
jgi:endonuclease/exonuclease/phosphatase (EEP) superfamily protein YafD